MSLAEKYDRLAAGWSDTAYGDPGAYLRHRAELTVRLGPPLRAGDTVLDLGAADAGVAEYLVDLGLRYTGVDLAPKMADAAHARLGDRVRFAVGDLNEYEPPAPVTATTCFRAIYYADDRAAFFRRVAGYTERKFVFDFSPRRVPLAEVERDLRLAGFDRLVVHPFFVPQSVRLPRPAIALLRGLERAGPLARLLLRHRFSVVCAASRGG
jgi:ubiquinone/menaquinone biosynthesis C-methylase UbiE